MRKRTFFTTLLLFILFFNSAILWMVLCVWNDRLETQTQRSLSEHYFISCVLQKDLQLASRRGIDPEVLLPELAAGYAILTKNPQTELAVCQVGYGEPDFATNGFLYSLLPALNGQERLVMVEREGKQANLFVYGALPSPYETTVLCYQFRLDEILATWRQLKNTMFLTGAVFSGILSVALLLLLGRLFQPLQQISAASGQIAQGDFQGRLPVKGDDELSEMARSFNGMAEEIQRQIEELREVSARKQRFVDNLAHELRTPLTAIYGHAEFLRRAAADEETRLVATGYILSECKRIQSVAEQLLQLSAMQHDSLRTDKIMIKSLFEDVVQSIQPKADMQEVTISQINKGDFLWGNKELLESLLLNLLDNAIKASPAGGVVLLTSERSSRGLVLSVTDSGIGMTAQQLAHVKEAFYRVDKARSRRDGGAGLGLALCEQIANLHGAALELNSMPGEGTAVTVTFTT